MLRDGLGAIKYTGGCMRKVVKNLNDHKYLLNTGRRLNKLGFLSIPLLLSTIMVYEYVDNN